MAAPFVITSGTSTASLDAHHRGTVTFAVQNTSGRALRARARVETGSNDGQRASWYALADTVSYDFAVDGAHDFVVNVAVPANEPAGTHRFHLVVVGEANPDEDQARSDDVSIVVVARPRRPLPWLLIAAGGGVLLALIAIAVVVIVATRKPAPPPATTLAANPAAIDLVAIGPGLPSGSTAARVTNTGNLATPLRVKLAGDSPNQFRITADRCGGATLKPGETCVMAVQFEGKQNGAFTAILRVEGDNGARADFQLRGQAPFR